MKKMLLVLLLAMPGLAVIAQNEKGEPYLTKQLNTESIKDVEVQTSGGYINVTAVSASEARVEVYIRGNNGKDNLSADEIKKRLEEKYELSVTVANNKLTAVARRKRDNGNDWKRGLSISFAVFVPKNVSTDLSTSGGSIQLIGVSGKQDFSTSGGSLHVENVSGKINGRTSGGSIHVSNSTDEIELTTSGGSISASDCTGKIKLVTSGGSLNFKDLEGEIKATTSGGSILGKKVTGELITHTSGGSIQLKDMACTLEASTSGGKIDVSMASLGKYVKLKNSGGNIDLQLPAGKGLNLDLAANSVKVDQLTNFSGNAEKDQIKGTMNGGGIPVSAISGSGRVSLDFK